VFGLWVRVIGKYFLTGLFIKVKEKLFELKQVFDVNEIVAFAGNKHPFPFAYYLYFKMGFHS